MPQLQFATAKAMEINQLRRSEIKSVRPENIVTFNDGILGFESVKDFVFLVNEKVQPFMFLQAITPSDLSFVCVESFIICPDYNITLSQQTVQTLRIVQPSDILLLNLVTVRQNVEEITANMMSPLVINMKNMRGQQVILENTEYKVRYRIWDAIEELGMIAQ